MVCPACPDTIRCRVHRACGIAAKTGLPPVSRPPTLTPTICADWEHYARRPPDRRVIGARTAAEVAAEMPNRTLPDDGASVMGSER